MAATSRQRTARSATPSAKPEPTVAPTARKSAARPSTASAKPASKPASKSASAGAVSRQAVKKPAPLGASTAAAGAQAAADPVSVKRFGQTQASDGVPPFAPLGDAGGIGEAVDAMSAIGQGMGTLMQSLAGLSVQPDALSQIQQDYISQSGALWNSMLEQPAAIELADKRFAAPAWRENPGSAFMAAMYLLNANTLKRLADSLQGDKRSCDKVRFAVQQWVDAASPSNFLAFNPEAQQLALKTKGESLNQGMQHLVHDIEQGHLSQTDERLFEVGRNVATSEGSVVFENAYFQLIEYKPLTDQVRATPFLIVPPCINKFYILDLQPHNSLVRHVVDKGQHCFLISWVNPDESLAQAGWDDFVEQGVIKAIEVVQAISGVEKINALGFCIGGTLLGCALAVLAARGQRPVANLTLLTAYLDFCNTGPMDVFVDEPMVRVREMTMGAHSPQGGGLMKGGDLATTFSFLRPNDLVWNYVVGNYLKGEAPPAFDLLYWNSDSTNMPGPMYCWYLRNTYLENKLRKPGAITVCGVPLDLRLIDMPAFIYGSREDHIVPWDSAYASTQLLSGPKTFVLGASGHIAGVINPPASKKRSFWVSPSQKGFPADHQQWLAGAQEQPGSWWPTWLAWLDERSGPWMPAPTKAGSRAFPPIEAAPGRYVKRRA